MESMTDLNAPLAEALQPPSAHPALAQAVPTSRAGHQGAPVQTEPEAEPQHEYKREPLFEYKGEQKQDHRREPAHDYKQEPRHETQQQAKEEPKSTATPEQPDHHAEQLKRLQVLADAGSLAYATGEEIYKRLKPLTPLFVERVVKRVVPPVSNTAQQLLRAADDKVDSMMAPVEAKREDKEFTANVPKGYGLETLISAMSAAGDYVVILAKEGQSSISSGVQSAHETLQSAMEKARSATDPDVAMDMAWDAWNKFSSYPAVNAVVTRAEPAANYAMQNFMSLHDNLVTSEVYKKAFETAASTLNYATTTTPYKLGAQYLYPIVQPVADPAIEKVSNSKVVNQVMDYWKPQETTPLNAQ